MIGWSRRTRGRAEARAKRQRGRSNVWSLRLLALSSAAASPQRWSFLSGACSQRCHGPRSGCGSRRRKPAPGGARRGGREMPEAVPRLPGRVSGLRGPAGRAGTGVARARGGLGPGRVCIQSLVKPFPHCSASLRHTLLPSRCFSETGSPRTHCVAKDKR